MKRPLRPSIAHALMLAACVLIGVSAWETGTMARRGMTDARYWPSYATAILLPIAFALAFAAISRWCKAGHAEHLRPTRGLLNLLTLLSLLLCVATVAMWVRSHVVCDSVDRLSKNADGKGGVAWSLRSNRGLAQMSRVAYGWDDQETLRQQGHERVYWVSEQHLLDSFQDLALTSTDRSTLLARLGVYWNGDNLVGRPWTYRRGVYFQFPLWLPAVLFAPAPLTWVCRRLRRPRTGCCRYCDYDLRATPDRCPECGRVTS